VWKPGSKVDLPTSVPYTTKLRQLQSQQNESEMSALKWSPMLEHATIIAPTVMSIPAERVTSR
jgi:hypothetical protein